MRLAGNSLNALFVTACVLVALAGGALIVGVSSYEIDQRMAELANQAEAQANLTENMLQEIFEANRRKVRFLRSTPPVPGLARAALNQGVDPLDGTLIEEWKSRLTTIFRAFLAINPELKQVRYIGVADGGRELVRANFKMGEVETVREDNLQRKGQTDYFSAIAGTARGHVYISDVNLNREDGKIVFPYEPVLRVGTPVYTDSDQLFGMVVINIDARSIDRLLQTGLDAKFKLYITNSTGGILFGPDGKYDFRFDSHVDGYWDQLFTTIESQSGGTHFLKVRKNDGPHGIFTVSRDVAMSGPDESRFMRLIVALPEEYVQAEIFSIWMKNIFSYSGVVIVALLLVVFYQSNIRTSIKLTEAQRRFEAIVNGSQDAIIATDAFGAITSWNVAAQVLFGINAHQAIGRSVNEVVKDQSGMNTTAHALGKIVQKVNADPVTIDILGRDGSVINVMLTVSPILSNQMKLDGFAIMARDVTAARQYERHIKDLNEGLEKQVQERTSELEDAMELAQASSKAKSHFIANISHEIRTPLNGIVGMLALMRKSKNENQRLHFLDLAEKSVEGLSLLVNEVLDFSKIEAGKSTIHEVAYDLEKMISELVDSMSISAQQKHIELLLDLTGLQHAFLIGDKDKLRQIVINLLSNAIKFTEQGWVRVVLESTLINEHEVEIQGIVEDTGIGIDEEAKSLLFKAFSQEDSSVTRRFGGTGLGLAISRHLCRMLNGDIIFDSLKNRGSAFRFSIVQTLEDAYGRQRPRLDLAGASFAIVGPGSEANMLLGRMLKAWNAGSVTVLDRFDQSVLAPLHLDTLFFDEAVLPEIQLPLNGVRVVMLMGRHSLMEPHPDRAENMICLFKPVTPYGLKAALEKEAQTSVDVMKHSDSMPGQSPDNGNKDQEVGASGKVLIVDDNPINQEVAHGLLQYAGIQADIVSNGEEAISTLANANGRYSLVFMDCQMPVMDGYTATRRIREGEAGQNYRQIPIVAMTASAMEGDRERCVAAGMDDYLTKPLDSEVVVQKAQLWLKRSVHVAISDNERTRVAAVDIDELQQSIWNKAALLKRVRNEASRAEKLISVFCELLPERMASLKMALDNSDLEKIAEVSHSLKGSAGSIGATQMNATCGLVETHARAGALDEVRTLVMQLEAERDTLVDLLDLEKGHC